MTPPGPKPAPEEPRRPAPDLEPAEDEVDEASEESFPSSDPPEHGGPSLAGRS
jgi:hypothetical protein